MKAQDFYKNYWTYVEMYTGICRQLEQYEEYEKQQCIKLNRTCQLREKKAALQSMIKTANPYY